MWSVFNQNLFSFAGDDDRQDVKVSILQLIIKFSLPNKWSIGVSEMNITYDWEKSAWTSLPLGMKINKLVNFGKLPVMFSGAYEYNFQDDYVAPEWTVNFTLKFLFLIWNPLSLLRRLYWGQAQNTHCQHERTGCRCHLQCHWHDPAVFSYRQRQCRFWGLGWQYHTHQLSFCWRLYIRYTPHSGTFF